ncbi:unnamed protein product [Nezara viridula]|uniref:LIM zinc-binding domain-containing protein n=1 Tax=Nezara viridula TaxID=85310 RepID=A0A9P0ED34_NEZVI|nr:unnamed protein product [Nezara viridula]
MLVFLPTGLVSSTDPKVVWVPISSKKNILHCPPNFFPSQGRGAGGLVNTNAMIIVCAACEKPILDKFLLNVLDRTWHAECVRCFDCHSNLTDKCFSREGKLFCRNDFFRTSFASKLLVKPYNDIPILL